LLPEALTPPKVLSPAGSTAQSSAVWPVEDGQSPPGPLMQLLAAAAAARARHSVNGQAAGFLGHYPKITAARRII
jgi:hypothetical protein